MSVEREMGRAGFNAGVAIATAVGLAHNYADQPLWAIAFLALLILNAWHAGKALGRALQLRRW